VVFFLCASFLLPSCAEYPMQGQITSNYGTLSVTKSGKIFLAPKARRVEVPILGGK